MEYWIKYMTLLLVSWLAIICLCAAYSNERKPDKLFDSETKIAGRTVTCNATGARNDTVYASDTWTCHNMRVDGFRMRFWYRFAQGSDTACSDGIDKYDGRNDFAALCRAMLREHGIHRSLWSAFINDAACKHSIHRRAVFVKSSSRKDDYEWEIYDPGQGYFNTLRCMVDAPNAIT